MTFQERKNRALALMEEKKMWRSNYAPPQHRLLWRWGIKLPPPPFTPFWLNFLYFGINFGVIWGIVMWCVDWRIEGCGALVALQRSTEAGLMFGLAMALFHAWRKYANNLPDWKDLH